MYNIYMRTINKKRFILISYSYRDYFESIGLVQLPGPYDLKHHSHNSYNILRTVFILLHNNGIQKRPPTSIFILAAIVVSLV